MRTPTQPAVPVLVSSLLSVSSRPIYTCLHFSLVLFKPGENYESGEPLMTCLGQRKRRVTFHRSFLSAGASRETQEAKEVKGNAPTRIQVFACAVPQVIVIPVEISCAQQVLAEQITK